MEQADITKAISDSLRNIFEEGEKAGRFIDVTRIPLICASIVDMHQNINSIQNNLKWIMWLGSFFGGGVLIGLGMIVLKFLNV